MNSKGVSFARWIQEESEQNRTLRNADSSGVLSDWCAPTPVDSQHHQHANHPHSSNNNTTQAAAAAYSSDKTWRFVLLGMCSGSIFTAITSLGVLGMAGRQTTFQNLLEVTLTPKQTRMLLLLNLCGICFSALTASGVVSWFTRSKMRLLGLTQSMSFNGDSSSMGMLRSNSSMQALEDMIDDREGSSPLRVETPIRTGSSTAEVIARRNSNSRFSRRYYGSGNRRHNSNNNDDDDEGEDEYDGMNNNNNGDHNNDVNTSSHMEVFTAKRPESALKGRRNRKNSAIVNETNVVGNNEQEGYSASAEQTINDAENGDSNNNNQNGEKTIYDATPLQSANDNNNNNDERPPAVLSSIVSSSTNNTNGVTSTSTATPTRTSTPHDPLDNTTTFQQPSALPPLPNQTQKQTPTRARNGTSNNNSVNVSKHSTPIRLTSPSSVGNSPSQQRARRSSFTSVSSSPTSAGGGAIIVTKRDASTETQIEYFAQPPVQAPIMPLNNNHNNNNSAIADSSSSNNQAGFFPAPNSITGSPAALLLSSSHHHNNHNNKQQQLLASNNSLATGNNSLASPASGPSSFASADAALNQQLQQQAHQQTSGMIFANVVTSASGNNVLTNINSLSNNTNNKSENEFGNDEQQKGEPTHPAHHPDLHLNLPGQQQQQVPSNLPLSISSHSIGALHSNHQSPTSSKAQHTDNSNSSNNLLNSNHSQQHMNSSGSNNQYFGNNNTPSSYPHTPQTNNNSSHLQPGLVGGGVAPVSAVPNMAAFVPHAFRTIDLNMNQINANNAQSKPCSPRGHNNNNVSSSRTQTPREPPGNRTGNFLVAAAGGNDNNAAESSSTTSPTNMKLALPPAVQQHQQQPQNSSFGSDYPPPSAGPSNLGTGTLVPGNNNNRYMHHHAPPPHSPSSITDDGTTTCSSPSGSLLASPSSRNNNAYAGDYKWWDNVTAATAAHGTVLALHIGLKQDVQFSGSSVLPEAARNDLDAVSRLISIALEVGDSYGAVIDSFNLQWVIMSFNILRPCTDHEKMAALCALAIRNRFIQLSSLMSASSSPMTETASNGSPLTNPSLRPLVPFSIGIEKGPILGGHVGHGTILRSFVLYGSPVERARDLAVLGATICGWMSPILVSDVFNDLIGASCSSLLVDFVEFNCDSAGRGLNHDGLYDSPSFYPDSASSVSRHGSGDLQVTTGDEDHASPLPRRRRGSSGSHHHYSPKNVVRVFDLYEEFDENEEHSPFEAHLSPTDVAELHNDNGTPKHPSPPHHERNPSSASAGSSASSPRLSIREEFELVRKEMTEDYHSAIALMRCGKLDECLDVCARLEGETTSTWLENLLFSHCGAVGGSSSGHHQPVGSPFPKIPAWLFQIRRHLSRLRRNAQNLLMKGLEGTLYVRQTQARWIIFAGDTNQSPSSSPMLPILRRDGNSIDNHPNTNNNSKETLESGDTNNIDIDNNDQQQRSNLVSPSPPGTDDMFDKTYRSAMRSQYRQHFSRGSKDRDNTSMDMTSRSLKLLDQSQYLSRTHGGGGKRGGTKNQQDSPNRMIALLQAQATNPNSVTAAAANANAIAQQQSSLMRSGSSVPRPMSAQLLNSPDQSTNPDALIRSGDDLANYPTNQNNNLHSPSPQNNTTVLATTIMNDGIPELFQDYNGTWYRSSTKVLGRGAFGAVRLGIRTYDGILVAMKLLPIQEEDEDLELSVTQRRRKQQRRILSNQNLDEHDQEQDKPPSSNPKLDKVVEEIRLLTTLKNSNVVTLHTCAVVNSNIVIVLEYVSGGSLESLLNSFGTFDISSTQRYLKDVLRGLRYIHEKGYIHRDIKPGNVLMQTDGSCKLADLGSSIAIKESLKRNIAVQGTPYFMSPEAARGAAVSASDIWAVGILAAQLVSGKICLKAASDGVVGEAGLHRLLYHLAHEPVEFDMPDQVLREEHLYSFVNQCLRSKHEERPTAEQLLNHPFLMAQYRNSHVVASASPSVARKRKHHLHHHLNSVSHSSAARSGGRNGGGGGENEPLSSPSAGRHHNHGNGQVHLQAQGQHASSTSKSRQRQRNADGGSGGSTSTEMTSNQRQGSSSTAETNSFGPTPLPHLGSQDTLAPTPLHHFQQQQQQTSSMKTHSTTTQSSGNTSAVPSDLPLSPNRVHRGTPLVPAAAIEKRPLSVDSSADFGVAMAPSSSSNNNNNNNNNNNSGERNPFLSVDREDTNDEDNIVANNNHHEGLQNIINGNTSSEQQQHQEQDPVQRAHTLAAFEAALSQQNAFAISDTASSVTTGGRRSQSNATSSGALHQEGTPSPLQQQYEDDRVINSKSPERLESTPLLNRTNRSLNAEFDDENNNNNNNNNHQQQEGASSAAAVASIEEQSFTPANRDSGDTAPPSANSTM